MDKTNLIKAVIEGRQTDQVPYSFWSHMPDVDLDPYLLADRTYEFYKKYDVDFIKTMPNGMFSIEDFGCEVDYSEIKSGGVAKIVKYPIATIEDWDKIESLDINKGALGRELHSLELLMKKMNKEAPVIVTAFSPLTTAVKLSNNKLLQHIKEGNSNYIHKALDYIAETTANYIRRAVEIGASGVFFASQASSYDYMTKEQYEEFGVPYDIKALSGSSKGWFNAIHIHGNNIMFDLVKDYPVNVLNWHLWETNPTLTDARKLSDKCFMGGIIRSDITNCNKEKVSKQINDTIVQSNKTKQIVTPGCVIRYPLNEDMLQFVKDEVQRVSNSTK